MQLFDIALIKLTALIYLVYEGLNLILVAEELTGGCFVFGLLCFKLLLFFKAFMLCFVNLSLRFAQLVLGLFELFNLFVKAVDNPLFVFRGTLHHFKMSQKACKVVCAHEKLQRGLLSVDIGIEHKRGKLTLGFVNALLIFSNLLLCQCNLLCKLFKLGVIGGNFLVDILNLRFNGVRLFLNGGYLRFERIKIRLILLLFALKLTYLAFV